MQDLIHMYQKHTVYVYAWHNKELEKLDKFEKLEKFYMLVCFLIIIELWYIKFFIIKYSST